MYKQTETKYKNIKLGFGDGSIYDYGCYLVSLCNGLNQKGYDYTPEGLNDLFKLLNAFVGPYRNYIDVDNLSKYLPLIFESYQRIDPWNDVPKGNDLIKDNLVVLGRVSAKAIGGTGDHFVLFTGIDNGIVKIHDPWKGVEEKITVRWGNLGNILGIRIFKIKPKVITSEPIPPIITDQTKLDTGEGIMEWQQVKSLLKDRKVVIDMSKGTMNVLVKENNSLRIDLEESDKACSKKVELAKTEAIIDYQQRLKDADIKYETLLVRKVENFSSSTLFSLAIKNLFNKTR